MDNRIFPTLSDSYHDWMAQYTGAPVEYIGINMDAAGGTTFKVYLKPSACLEDSSPLIDAFRNADMLRTLTRIERPQENLIHYDIGLAHRNNQAMQGVFAQLARLPFIDPERMRLCTALAQMPISEDPQYAFASLYFLGIQEKMGRIQQVKLHYLTRMCEDPDQPGRHPTYPDARYLEYLCRSGSVPLVDTAQVVDRVLERVEGHLWMVGLDYAVSGKRKYKVYLKSKDKAQLEMLADVLEEGTAQHRKLLPALRRMSAFTAEEPGLRIAGCALCTDDDQNWTVNYYGKLD